MEKAGGSLWSKSNALAQLTVAQRRHLKHAAKKRTRSPGGNSNGESGDRHLCNAISKEKKQRNLGIILVFPVVHGSVCARQGGEREGQGVELGYTQCFVYEVKWRENKYFNKSFILLKK